MHPAMAQGLIDGDDWVEKIFTPEFSTARKWRDYMLDKFGGGMTVNTILDKTSGWAASDFHALYIACWIFYPVEKGTFMIPLTAQQRKNVKSGYQNLDPRWTSHLHKHGRSAAKGWKFLKGYGELLVQMEGGGKHTQEIEPHLFLKCEGHTAFTVAHLKSYFEKKSTGKGAVANSALQELAKNQAMLGMDQGLGITERAAENYSNPYKALLVAAGLTGKTKTVHEAVANFYILLDAEGRTRSGITPPLNSLVAMKGLQAAVGQNGVGGLDNEDLAKMIEEVLLPFALAARGATGGSAKGTALIKAMLEAEDDLKKVAQQLREDAKNTGQAKSLRYFQEVVLAPFCLNSGLRVAYELLSAK